MPTERMIGGASKIKLKKVNKKRTVRIRRENSERGGNSDGGDSSATVAIVVLTPAKN